jgi:hypothetical protein
MSECDLLGHACSSYSAGVDSTLSKTQDVWMVLVESSLRESGREKWEESGFLVIYGI